MPYVPKPKPCFIDQFEFYRVIDGRKVYRGNKRYYSWDEFHGESDAAIAEILPPISRFKAGLLAETKKRVAEKLKEFFVRYFE